MGDAIRTATNRLAAAYRLQAHRQRTGQMTIHTATAVKRAEQALLDAVRDEATALDADRDYITGPEMERRINAGLGG